MSRHPRLVAAATLLGAACGSSRPAPDLQRDVERTADAVAREAAEQRDGAETAIEQKLAELERQITRVRAAIRAARYAKADAEKHLLALERESRALRVRLERAHQTGARAGREVEGAIDRALEDVERTWGLSEDGEAPR
jgi:chromosome segregation ATPase